MGWLWPAPDANDKGSRGQATGGTGAFDLLHICRVGILVKADDGPDDAVHGGEQQGMDIGSQWREAGF
jgi:hypothetical protein